MKRREGDTGLAEEEVYADWRALRFLLPGVLVAIVCVTVVVFAYLQFAPDGAGSGSDEQTAEEAALAELTPHQAAQAKVDEFTVALAKKKISGFEFAFSTGLEAQAELDILGEGLGTFEIQVASEPVELIDTLNAVAPTEISWRLIDEDPFYNGAEFSTSGSLELVLIGSNWVLDWDPSILESSLVPGDVVRRERVVKPRAPIVARDGTPVASDRPAIQVGVVKRPVNDILGLANQLAPILRIDSGDIVDTISPRPSDEFIPLATFLPEQLDPIRASLESIVGVEFQDVTALAPISPSFGRAWLGRSGPATKEILDNNPELFSLGDIVGLSGLQATYNQQLASQPGFQIVVARRFKQPKPTPTTTGPEGEAPTTATSEGAEASVPEEQATPEDAAQTAETNPDVLYSSPATEGAPLQLTIDAGVQQAAEQALTKTQKVSALVAIEASTGQVLAAANGPGAAVDNYAFTGQYPPGSIFKTVTVAGALTKGLALDTPVDCPLTLVVDGREFKNAEGEVLGQVPLRTNYALSCNTGFINIGSVLEPSDFPAAAATLGVGVGYDVGIASFSGNVPAPSSAVEKAAESFGQGPVLVSPLSMAVMSASVASGVYTPPSFVVDPEAATAAPVPLDPQIAGQLQELMRAVVAEGTGGAVNGVPGEPVSGKTGTAEFGNEVPPQSHAWFIGFQGDIAFAVFVEAGEFGGATAAPIAADFLTILAQSG